MAEQVDIYDHMGTWIGVADRRVANQTGLWHVCAQCWVLVGTDLESASLLIQRRSLTKNVAPGKLDVSASGHVPSGATSSETAVQELDEELGLTASSEELVALGRRIDMYQDGPVLSRIFADVYLLHRPTISLPVNYDKQELDGVLLLPVLAGLELCLAPQTSIRCRGWFSRESSNAVESDMDVRLSDFIPRHDRYYLKTLICCQRYLSGEAQWAI